MTGITWQREEYGPLWDKTTSELGHLRRLTEHRLAMIDEVLRFRTAVRPKLDGNTTRGWKYGGGSDN